MTRIQKEILEKMLEEIKDEKSTGLKSARVNEYQMFLRAIRIDEELDDWIND